MDHSAAASLPRYGASEGQARPARPRARPRGPRLQRARIRRAPLTPAPARGQERRSEGTVAEHWGTRRKKSVRLIQGAVFEIRTREGVGGSNPCEEWGPGWGTHWAKEGAWKLG